MVVDRLDQCARTGLKLGRWNDWRGEVARNGKVKHEHPVVEDDAAQAAAAERALQLVSRDCLAKLAWGREPDSVSRTVDMHIYRRRLKLSLRPENGATVNIVDIHQYRLDEADSTTGQA